MKGSISIEKVFITFLIFVLVLVLIIPLEVIMEGTVTEIQSFTNEYKDLMSTLILFFPVALLIGVIVQALRGKGNSSSGV